MRRHRPKRRRRKKMSKAASQRKHAHKRALERHGIHLTRSAQEKLIKKIQSGEAEALLKQSHRVTIFSVNHRESGKDILVAYDKKRHTIITVLPEEARVNYTSVTQW